MARSRKNKIDWARAFLGAFCVHGHKKCGIPAELRDGATWLVYILCCNPENP